MFFNVSHKKSGEANERADVDLTCMKSSKERVKGTDYVNSMRLILQYLV